MKTKLFFLLGFVICIVQGTFATHIIKAPGSTTDIYSELPIKSMLLADTLFIEGGTGDIILKAGPTNISTYDWDIDGGSISTYTITFTYVNATFILPDGSKGRLINCIRADGLGGNLGKQYVWIVYRNLPLKPTTPLGSTSVCTGSSKNYTSTSTNSTSYQWYLSPAEAGTLVNGTTNAVTVNWSNSWTGNASLTVKGVEGTNESPISDPLMVAVGTIPTKPIISGDPFVKKGSSSVFTGSSTSATSWIWTIDPASGLATSTPSGNQTTLNFTATGNLTVKLQTSNACGNSIISDNFAVEIVDITALQSQVTTLTASNTTLTNDLATRTTERDQALTDKATLQGQVNTLTTTLATRTTERDNALADKATLQGQVNTLTTTLATRTTERDQALADKAALQSQVNTLTTTLATRTTERDQALTDKATLQGQVNTLTTTLATRTTERDQALTDKATLQGQVNTLTTTLATRTTERDQALADKAALQSQVNTLTTTLATRTTERDQALADKAALQSQVNTLTNSNNTLTNRVTELETQVAALSKVYTLSWEVTEVVTSVFDTEIGKFSVSLYPNPSPGEVFIKCSEEIKIVKIFSLQGQLLKEFVVNGTETSFIVTRNEMPVGTYLINIETTKGRSTHRIIFQ